MTVVEVSAVFLAVAAAPLVVVEVSLVLDEDSKDKLA